MRQMNSLSRRLARPDIHLALESWLAQVRVRRAWSPAPARVVESLLEGHANFNSGQAHFLFEAN